MPKRKAPPPKLQAEDERDPYKVLMGMRLEMVRKLIRPNGDLRSFAVEFIDEEGTVQQKESRYRKWEVGESFIPHRYLARLRDEYGVSPDYMVSTDPKRLEPEFFPMKRRV